MTEMMTKANDRFETSHNQAIHWIDERQDPALQTVDRAVRQGHYQAARTRFLKLAESSQIGVLQHIPQQDAVRLAGGLPTYTVARLFERLPRHLGRAIVQSLPEGKRQGVVVILNHRRHDPRNLQRRQLQG
ncbi:hypothetical protein [Ectothiorhodospira sp. BSL-9]|uniref:hypothetical protein n=1 Tax=Ectothiorhodospira sp. BSL-9 TaxID=1442136 RepID=UPI0007B42C48|nr:hypothetical protein [Ectothiorhodospira sp. BSL-9]ANB01392.1 hypothetical protein ECTOBSL9_0490 [Ectothiorhodospira sp. BSL-9]TVQ72443.1 MAG: hypothetical protein EA372_07475 [Chromatiaceae bacterium]